MRSLREFIRNILTFPTTALDALVGKEEETPPLTKEELTQAEAAAKRKREQQLNDMFRGQPLSADKRPTLQQRRN